MHEISAVLIINLQMSNVILFPVLSVLLDMIIFIVGKEKQNESYKNSQTIKNCS